MNSLPIDSIIIYSDGSRSQTSQIGAGWVIYRKGLNGYITVSEDHAVLVNEWRCLTQNCTQLMKALIVFKPC
jgi:hypothetical protein